MSGRDCFTINTIVLFEFIFSIAAYFDCDAVKMELQSSTLHAWGQSKEKNWSIPLTDGVKYLPWESIDKVGKGTIMFESSIRIFLGK